MQLTLQCTNATIAVQHLKKTSELSVHMTERHTTCTYCRKLFSTPKVLEIHIQAIHKKENMKHTIEREPSLKDHKMKR